MRRKLGPGLNVTAAHLRLTLQVPTNRGRRAEIVTVVRKDNPLYPSGGTVSGTNLSRRGGKRAAAANGGRSGPRSRTLGWNWGTDEKNRMCGDVIPLKKSLIVPGGKINSLTQIRLPKGKIRQLLVPGEKIGGSHWKKGRVVHAGLQEPESGNRLKRMLCQEQNGECSNGKGGLMELLSRVRALGERGERDVPNLKSNRKSILAQFASWAHF